IGNAPRIRELMELAKEAKEEVVRSRERATSSMFEDGIDHVKTLIDGVFQTNHRIRIIFFCSIT
ncbi:MAG: hypothetical protein PHC91_08175, partial [Eubacteriales bacterium]|nr:hypothetical protein [Eubacteriales bacterium]